MNRGAGVVVVFILVVLAVALGALARDLVVGLLVVAGLTLVWIGCAAANGRAYGRAWLAIAMGVLCTAVGMSRAEMAGRWLWLVPWMLEGVVVAAIGAGARSDSRRHGESLVAFGLLLMVFAALAPLFVYPALSETAAGTGGGQTGLSIAEGLRTVGATLREAVTSLWGWLNMGVLVLIGAASWRRAGAWLAPALALAAAFVVGSVSAAAGEAFAAAAGESPAAWLEDLVLATNEHWGTAGWGILLLSGGVVAVSLPLMRKLFVMNQVAGAAQRAHGSDAAAVERFVTDEGYGPGMSMLVLFAYQVLYVGTVAMLWTGLRRATDVAGPLPFGAIGIPDLAVPDFRPVWGLSYFVLALGLGVCAVANGRIYARRSVSPRVPVLTSPVWQIGIVLIGAFIAPAGLMLLGVGATLTQAAVAAPLSRRRPLRHDTGEVIDLLARFRTGGETAPDQPVWAVAAGGGADPGDVDPGGGGGSAGDAGPEGGSGSVGDADAIGRRGQGARGFDGRPVWERDGQGEVPIWGAPGEPVSGEGAPGEPAPGDTPPPAEPTAVDATAEPTAADATAVPTAWPVAGPMPGFGSSVVSVLFQAGSLIDLAATGDDEYVVLGEGGELTVYRGDAARRAKRLQVLRPLGLGSVSAGHVAFVEGAGRVLEVSLADADYPDDPWGGAVRVVHSGVVEESDCFAVSPQGTLVVCAAAGRRQVTGFFLSSEIKRTLLDGVERPSALGFSADGRLVAVGTGAGAVFVADVGGQGPTATLSGAPVGGRAVVAVTGAPDGRWLVAYESERLALWDDGECVTHVDTGGPVTCLAVDDAGGRVAVCTSLGLVRVHAAGLAGLLADERLFTGAVRRVLFAGGGVVVCAAAAGEVRRLELA